MINKYIHSTQQCIMGFLAILRYSYTFFSLSIAALLVCQNSTSQDKNTQSLILLGYSNVAGDREFEEDRIKTYAIYKDELYMAGFFSAIGNNKCRNIAKYDGKELRQFGNGSQYPIQSLIVYKNELYAASRGLRKWNDKNWVSVTGREDGNILIGSSNYSILIKAMCIYKNELYIGGEAGPISSESSTLAKWDGNEWTAFGKDFYMEEISIMTTFKDKMLVYSASGFKNDSGEDMGNIVQWDGQTKTPINNLKLDGKIKGRITSLCAFDDLLFIGHPNGLLLWNGSDLKNLYEDVMIYDIQVVGKDVYFASGYNDRIGMYSNGKVSFIKCDFYPLSKIYAYRNNLVYLKKEAAKIEKEQVKNVNKSETNSNDNSTPVQVNRKTFTQSKDYIFCYGEISLTLYDGGRAEQIRYGANKSIIKKISGEWTAYGSPSDNPGQTVKIIFNVSPTEFSYTLIRDGYGKPSRLIDGTGRIYEICNRALTNSSGMPDIPGDQTDKNIQAEVKIIKERLDDPKYEVMFPTKLFSTNKDIKIPINTEGCQIKYWYRGSRASYPESFNGYVLNRKVYNSNNVVLGEIPIVDESKWRNNEYFFIEYQSGNEIKRVAATRKSSYFHDERAAVYGVYSWDMKKYDGTGSLADNFNETQKYVYAVKAPKCLISAMALHIIEDNRSLKK